MQEPLSAAPCTSCARLVGLSHPTPNDPIPNHSPREPLRRKEIDPHPGKPKTDSSGQQGDRVHFQKPRPSPFKNWQSGIHLPFQLVIFAGFLNHHQQKGKTRSFRWFFLLKVGLPWRRKPNKNASKNGRYTSHWVDSFSMKLLETQKTTTTFLIHCRL